MPKLVFKGVKLEEIKDISAQLVDTLAGIANAPRHVFTLECVENPFIFDGEIVQPVPVVSVQWIDRGQATKDLMATAIDQAVRSKGYENVEVVFSELKKGDYYINAKVY